MSPVLLAIWLAFDIHGNSTCPSSAEVAHHLAALLPAAEMDPASGAYLSAGGDFVTVELLAPDGSLVVERRLERAGSCAEMAEAVAVVLAAWHARLTPTLAPAASSPPKRAASAPVAVVRSSPAIPARPPFLFDVGVGMLTSVEGSESAWGAKAEVVLSPSVRPLGLHAAFAMASPHGQSTSKPPAEAQWTRPALSVGPNIRLGGRTVALDIHGDGVVALLHLKGAGLSQNATDTVVQFGIAGGLRGLWLMNDKAVWLAVDVLGFPGRDSLAVENVGIVGELPRVELQISLGISLGQFR